MKNKLMVVLMVWLAIAAEARESNSEHNRREEKRKEAARERREHRRCGNEDEEERARIGEARRERHECREPIIDYGPPVPSYGYLGSPLPYYVPTVPCYGERIPGRFYPIPIPRPPVYVLPGMP
jgi:hypothetical protein